LRRIEICRHQAYNPKEESLEKTSFGKRLINYFIKTLNGIALGLLSTLINGVIIGQVGNLTGLDPLVSLSDLFKSFRGAGIGISVYFDLDFAFYFTNCTCIFNG